VLEPVECTCDGRGRAELGLDDDDVLSGLDAAPELRQDAGKRGPRIDAPRGLRRT
jgi:hypothetical protein